MKVRVTRDLSVFWINFPRLVLVCDEIRDRNRAWIPLAKCLFQGASNAHFEERIFTVLSRDFPPIVYTGKLHFRLVKQLDDVPSYAPLRSQFPSFVRLRACLTFHMLHDSKDE